MIKTIIFDAGNVLFKTNFEKIDRIIKKKYGMTILVHSSGNKDAIKEYKKESKGKGDLNKVFELLGARKKDISRIIKEYEKLYLRYKITNKKLLRLVKMLKGKYRVVCFTDTHKLHFVANKKINFFGDFDLVFASHLQKVIKEDAKAFKKLLKQLKNKPNETLFIDDNEINIKNAKSIGMNAILYKDFPKIKKLKMEIYKILNQITWK